MSIIQETKDQITKMIQDLGYEVTQVNFQESNRKDLGDYQITDAMQLAKTYHKNPQIIAQEIKEVLDKSNLFEKVTIAGPGFLNVTFKDQYLLDALNKMNESLYNNLDLVEKKRVLIDYGGANIAKTLHVGHLRSANLGEALKRLARLLGNEVISDVHFGDIGRQSGMVIYEIKQRYPNLNYFDESCTGPYDPLPITVEDLQEIYPLASQKAKENEKVLEEVREITMKIEQGDRGYTELWNKIKELSVQDIKQIYRRINTDFDLWEGETDSFPYIPEVIEKLKEKNLLYESEGAWVIDVKEETDKEPMPPLVVIKANGGTVYQTRELATLLSREKRFSLDEMWYLTDNRQELYFKQCFRAAKKGNLVKEDTKLNFYGFGTMNGPDGKPFKTRTGGVMNLLDLIEMVKQEIRKRMNPAIEKEKQESIAEIITIAAIKYADFLSFRSKDYIFDVTKFADLEGKTGPYLLYSTIRMKSLLEKVGLPNGLATKFKTVTDRELCMALLAMPTVLTTAYTEKSLNAIAEYLYRLASMYNKFYVENRISSEENSEIKNTWLVLTKVVKETCELLLTTLGIEVPEKM